MITAQMILLLLTALAGAEARSSGGGGGSRPSGGGSKPSGSSWGSKPSGSPPSGSRPSSPSKPSRPTAISSRNTSPSYKPLSPTGAPTVRNGGGGYSTAAKTAAVLGGGYVAVKAGSFFYGGRYSSPSCRGMYRYGSSYCPRGRSSTDHECTSQIPLCPIPEDVRNRWYVGSYPSVEVVADASTCSDLSPDLSLLAADSNAPADVNFTLDDCLTRVIRNGTCATSQFTFDEASGKCGCCAAGSSPTAMLDGNGGNSAFTSAVYSHSSSAPFAEHGPPTHCISGATLHWPEKVATGSADSDGAVGAGNVTSSGYADRTMDCECGACDTCGAPGTSYLDWSGPYTVPRALGDDGVAVSTDGDGTTAPPQYDPVDTCVCDVGGVDCERGYSSFSGGATTAALTGSSAVLVLVVASALGFGRLL